MSILGKPDTVTASCIMAKQQELLERAQAAQEQETDYQSSSSDTADEDIEYDESDGYEDYDDDDYCYDRGSIIALFAIVLTVFGLVLTVLCFYGYAYLSRTTQNSQERIDQLTTNYE